MERSTKAAAVHCYLPRHNLVVQTCTAPYRSLWASSLPTSEARLGGLGAAPPGRLLPDPRASFRSHARTRRLCLGGREIDTSGALFLLISRTASAVSLRPAVCTAPHRCRRRAPKSISRTAQEPARLLSARKAGRQRRERGVATLIATLIAILGPVSLPLFKPFARGRQHGPI